MIIRVAAMTNAQLVELCNNGKTPESRYAAQSELLQRKIRGR